MEIEIFRDVKVQYKRNAGLQSNVCWLQLIGVTTTLFIQNTFSLFRS